MSDPLVSVVIPTYNRAGYLLRTIASAVGQTYGNIEILVCDNASTDDTPRVVAEFERRHPERRIRYLRHGSNIGPVRNWFSGIQEADGPYIKILFSDDYLYPRAIEALLRPMVKTSYAFSYGKVDNLWEDSKVTNYGRQRAGYAVRSCDYLGAFFSSYLSMEDYPNSPCAAMLRTEAMRAIPLDAYTAAMGFDVLASGIGPDMLMFLYSYLFLGDEAVYVDERVAAFQGHKGSITVTTTLDRLDDHNFAAVLKFYAMLPDGCSMKLLFQDHFDALASQPWFFRRPKARLALLTRWGGYAPQERKPRFPYLGAALSHYRAARRVVEYRLGQARNLITGRNATPGLEP